MPSGDPIVVALIPSYNPGKFLRESVESLLIQTRPPDQIIIIDDASTDGSIDSLLELERQGRIEIRRNSENLGKAKSLNRAFEEIKADYFVLQDADDVALRNRVERQIEFMESNPRIGCSSGFVEYISSGGRKIGRGSLDLLNVSRLHEYLEGSEPFGLFCPAAIIRSETVRQPNLRFRGQFWPADDIDLWNRIAEAGWLVLAQPEEMVKYRIHGSSAVSSNFMRTRMQFEWVRACLRARRNEGPEPSHESFIQQWNSASFLHRINRSRKIAAKGFYRAGGFAVAERNHYRAAINLINAMLLDPFYSIKRLIQQLSKFCYPKH